MSEDKRRRNEKISQKCFIANLSQVVKKISVFSVKSCKLEEIAYILMSIIGKNERLVLFDNQAFILLLEQSLLRLAFSARKTEWIIFPVQVECIVNSLALLLKQPEIM